VNVGSLFSGDGLLDFGLELAGFDHAWFCEREADRRAILNLRWPGVPVYDDVRGIGADSVQRVDVIAGGFPCKGASTAGPRNGFDHPETVLWREMFRAIRELRPRYALLENVANLLALKRGAVWGEVLADLASIGYDTVWDCIPAGAVGAPHLRDRVFGIASHPDRMAGEKAEPGRGGPGAVAQPGTVERTERSDSDPAAHPGEGGRGESECVLRPGESDADGGAAPDPPRDAEGGAEPRYQPERRGVRVEWGPYDQAIHRWEQVAGPAPEPLVRRVDDRSASRVERSRLSALGDGVQVQVAEIVGRALLNFDRRGGVNA
jgi:DNA (cytosine-5)-methyltransferase 1